MASLSADRRAHIAAGHMEQRTVELAFKDLLAGIAGGIETVGKDAIDHGWGIGAPKNIQRRRRIAAGKRCGQIAVVEFRELLVTVMIFSGGAVESQVPVVRQFDIDAERALIVLGMTDAVGIVAKLVAEEVIHLFAIRCAGCGRTR